MKTISLIIIVLIVIFFGCTKESENKHVETKDAASNTEHSHEHEGEVKQSGLTLNNGNKWKADSPTNTRINNMNNVIAKFEKDAKKDYKAVGNELQTEIDGLLKECKMKGADHDALHTWLEPVIVLVNDLKNEDNSAEHKFEELKLKMNEYDQYFEL